jgi:hypothetical protein
MTEEEWLACTDPEALLTFLRGKASDRKLRLFTVACCRRIWGHLKNELGRRAVEVSECYADGLADKKELAQARSAVRCAGWDAVAAKVRKRPRDVPSFVAWCTVRETIAAAAMEAARRSVWVATSTIHPGGIIVGDLAGERAEQANLLRDIMGTPFRPVAVSPDLLSWHDATVVHLAQAVYGERHLPAGTLDNDRLRVLTDALEEAGCNDEHILAHCRSGGEHVRGCWVVDALLNKA